jgi:hypothetical protein
LEQARTEHEQLERLKGEMAAQEAQWKEAYDLLMAENKSLKSSGSEALLASQWRQRYEACVSEKEDLKSRLQMELEKSDALNENRRKEDAGKYEMKYRDLKESFRLYRKKAKEIFECQQRGDVAVSLSCDVPLSLCAKKGCSRFALHILFESLVAIGFQRQKYGGCKAILHSKFDGQLPNVRSRREGSYGGRSWNGPQVHTGGHCSHREKEGSGRKLVLIIPISGRAFASFF